MKILMGTQKLVKVSCELGSFKAILFHLRLSKLSILYNIFTKNCIYSSGLSIVFTVTLQLKAYFTVILWFYKFLIT